MTHEMLSCPLCGSTHTYCLPEHGRGPDRASECGNCGVRVVRATEAEAVAAWNTRASTSPVAASRVEQAAVSQNDAMRQELAHVGNLVSDLARVMHVDQANDDGSWPDLAGRIRKLIDAARTSPVAVDGSGERALAIVEAHAAKWRKRALKHIRPSGRTSDCEQRDLQRAALCDQIASDIRAALSTTPTPEAGAQPGHTLDESGYNCSCHARFSTRWEAAEHAGLPHGGPLAALSPKESDL